MAALVTSLDNVRENLIDFLAANGCAPDDISAFVKDKLADEVTHYTFDTNQGFRLILSLNIDGTYKDSAITTPEKKMAKGIPNKFVYISNNSNFKYKNFTPAEPNLGAELYLFNQQRMMYNPLHHYLQPPEIRIFRRAHDKAFFEEFGAEIENSSRVFTKDPVARFLLARIGDVIEYRNSTSVYSMVKLRIVVPKMLDDN